MLQAEVYLTIVIYNPKTFKEPATGGKNLEVMCHFWMFSTDQSLEFQEIESELRRSAAASEWLAHLVEKLKKLFFIYHWYRMSSTQKVLHVAQALLENVRLYWKGLLRTILFMKNISDEEKSFIRLTPGGKI